MNTAKGTPSLPDVKKNIRALLISAPRGLTVEDIEHDYQAVLGKPLPFEHFRCKNALEFLKTMPDVVAPTWNNGILILKGNNYLLYRLYIVCPIDLFLFTSSKKLLHLMKKDGKHFTPFSPKSSCMPAILAKKTGTGCSAASKNLVNYTQIQVAA
jgi:hypothetical protein